MGIGTGVAAKCNQQVCKTSFGMKSIILTIISRLLI
jgi:hypothetical protein